MSLLNRLAKWTVGFCLLAAPLFSATEPRFKAVDGRLLDTPPRMLGIAKGVYPESLSRRGKNFDGTVLLEFVVTKEGKMESPRVLQNSHAAFVAPTIELLHSSRYAPGTIAGEAVASRFHFLLQFDGSDGGGIVKGTSPYTVSPKSPDEYPPNLRYDSAPGISIVCDPVYPADLLLAGTKGKARVRYLLDPSGRVSAAEVVTATNPEFGAALVASIEMWQFAPALLKGSPTTTLLTHDYEFAPKIIMSDSGVQRILERVKDKSAPIAELDTLAVKPELIYQVTPQYPRALEPQRISGKAEVEFIIDRNGRVRLPKVLSATRPEFGWSAATAIQQWLYEHPKVNNKDVDVKTRVTLSFSP